MIWAIQVDSQTSFYYDVFLSYSKQYQNLAVVYGEVWNYHTIADWYNYCKEICTLVINNKDVEKIRQIGNIVEIDESKFDKKKFNYDKRVEGEWIFWGVE